MHSLVPPINSTIWQFLLLIAVLAIIDEARFHWPQIKAALRRPRRHGKD